MQSEAVSGAASPGRPGPAVGRSRRLFAAALLSLLIPAALLTYGAGRGFDLTDEVFYLVWTGDPTAYALTYQPFGYLLHPLFHLAGEDLQAWRLAGFAMAAVAGAFLALALPAAGGRRGPFAIYGAAAALTIFFPWIITPSYNSAANVGALLMLGGALRAFDARPPARLLAALTIGVGLCAAAFGKPPLFAIAGLALALTALAAPRARPALLAGLALAAVLMSLILPPGELIALLGRLSLSQHVLSLPNTPLALPAKIARDGLLVPWPLTAAAFAAAIGLVLRRSPGFLRAGVALGYAAAAFGLGYLAAALPDVLEGGGVPDFLGLALGVVAAGYAAMVCPRARADRLAVLALIAAPVAVALGTFNNQWFQLNFSLAFPFLALFALAAADPFPSRRAAARLLALAGPVAVMTLAAFQPYSLPAPIFDQQVPVAVPLAKGVIRVDAETAAFIRGARGLARGDLLVDLSGTGPGVAAVLGARAPVLLWLNPATPTWPDVVWSRLSPAERERASFVVPVWPAFSASAPARWLAAHRGRYCPTPLPPMTFWGERRALELWRPCAAPAGPGARPSPER